MKEKNMEQKNNKKYSKQISTVLLMLSVVLLFLTTFEFVFPIKAFLLGVFGVMIYPALLFTILFCSAVLSGRKFVYSAKYVAYLFLCFFFFMCILHTIFTGFSGQEFTYGEYLNACFNTLYTPGGLLIGIFTYPLTNLLHSIAGVVIYAIAFVISLYFVLSYLDNKKQLKVVEAKEPKYQSFNKIANDLNEEELEESQEENEEEVVEEELDEQLEEVEDEDDIFIKDESDVLEDEEENAEINLAKEKLGLIKREKTEEEPRKNKLYDYDKNETWQNRGVFEKEEKPQKIVYDDNQVVKPKVNTMYEKNKEYLNTLYALNLDSKNPIINAENYDDYKEKMRLYNEKNSKPFIRDFELNVNQTLYPSNKDSDIKEVKEQKIEPKQNVFDNNFGIEPNRKIEGLNASSNTINTNLDNNIKPITRDFTSFNASNNNFSGIESISKEETSSTFDSSIEGIDDEFINSITNFEPKISPLNPANFDVNSNVEKENISSQKFIEKQPQVNNEINPFDTSKLSSGDISNSLGNTYNLPKSMRNFNAGNNDNISVCATKSEEPNANEPNFKFDGKYIRPPIDLLETYVNQEDTSTNHERNIEVLERVLDEFKIPAKVEAVRRGASVTRYELHMPTGIPVRKIHAHASDIALALAAKGEVRIETPIRGKSAVGIEVPNAKIDTVGLKDIIASNEFENAKSPTTFALGKDVDGSVYCCNLSKMPHLLVAGSTGSGKSVCLNSLLISLLYRTSPEDLRLILVDPKRVEFGIYNDLPHLLMPKVITDPKKALNAFDWLINEMERRYTAFQECYVKDIKEYNAQPDVVSKKWQKLPYIVLVVDELADLVVTTNKKELEEKIIRLTQKARAAGIHVILATQRPSVDIITGSIKINLPARIAFAVTNFVDSKTILDQGGAEKLLGRGDMLYSPSDGEPTRVQGAFVDTPEVRKVVEFIKQNNKSSYDERISRIINSEGGNGGGIGNTATVGASSGEEFDSLMPDALKLVIENGQASISMLQRRFSIGFSRAARIIDQMELAKFISSSDGSKPRNVFITMDDYNKIYGN